MWIYRQEDDSSLTGTGADTGSAYPKIAMVFFLTMKTTRATLGRSGGALLGLLSLGLHGLVMSLPMPDTAPPALDSLADQPDPTEAIDVVRLPLAPPPAAELPPAPVVAPPAVANRSAQPVPSAPASPIPAPVQPEAPILPEPKPPEVTPEVTPKATLEERLRDPAEYAYNREVKALIADEVNLHIAVVPNWLEVEGQGLGDDEVPVMGAKQAPLQVAYPINSCLVPPPAEGLVGVIVTPAGQLAKAPILLDSTGYTVLDEKALELALERTFAPLAEGSDVPTNPRAHWLPVQVQYDPAGCVP